MINSFTALNSHLICGIQLKMKARWKKWTAWSVVVLAVAGASWWVVPQVIDRIRYPDPLGMFLEGDYPDSRLGMDVMVRRGMVSYDELAEYAQNPELSYVARVASIEKLSEWHGREPVVLKDILLSTELSNGISRDLAEEALRGLHKRKCVTPDLYPWLVEVYSTLPPWDDSFVPDLDPSIPLGRGGWYGCCIDQLNELAQVEILLAGDRALPVLNKLANGEPSRLRDGARELVKQLKSGDYDLSEIYYAYSYLESQEMDF